MGCIKEIHAKVTGIIYWFIPSFPAEITFYFRENIKRSIRLTVFYTRNFLKQFHYTLLANLKFFDHFIGSCKRGIQRSDGCPLSRSEERRVGKECRYRAAP